MWWKIGFIWIGIAKWFGLWHSLICMWCLYMLVIAWWFGIVAWHARVRCCADWFESSRELGLGRVCVFVHVRVLLEAEHGRWLTGTRFKEELRSYRSRMSCERFGLREQCTWRRPLHETYMRYVWAMVWCWFRPVRLGQCYVWCMHGFKCAHLVWSSMAHVWRHRAELASCC
jgi:hypothetical protein